MLPTLHPTSTQLGRCFPSRSGRKAPKNGGAQKYQSKTHLANRDLHPSLLSCETFLDSCQSQLPTETYFREAMSRPNFSTLKILHSLHPPTPSSQFISWNRATVIKHTTVKGDSWQCSAGIFFWSHNYRWQESKGHRTGTKQTYSQPKKSGKGPTSCSYILIFSHMINT